MRRQSSNARATSAACVRSPTTTSAPVARSASAAFILAPDQRPDRQAAPAQQLHNGAANRTDATGGAGDKDGVLDRHLGVSLPTQALTHPGPLQTSRSLLVETTSTPPVVSTKSSTTRLSIAAGLRAFHTRSQNSSTILTEFIVRK